MAMRTFMKSAAAPPRVGSPAASLRSALAAAAALALAAALGGCATFGVAQFLGTVRQVLQECGAAIRERDGVLTFLATQEIEPAKPLARPLRTARRPCRSDVQPANGQYPPV